MSGFKTLTWLNEGSVMVNNSTNIWGALHLPCCLAAGYFENERYVKSSELFKSSELWRLRDCST